MRGGMSILCEIERNKDSKTRKGREVIRKYKIASDNNIPSIKEKLKQKVQVKAQRERRFDKRNKSTGKIRSSRRMPKSSIEKKGKTKLW